MEGEGEGRLGSSELTRRAPFHARPGGWATRKEMTKRGVVANKGSGGVVLSLG